jgi:NitT/TauT family transport system ATP-binding protein
MISATSRGRGESQPKMSSTSMGAASLDAAPAAVFVERLDKSYDTRQGAFLALRDVSFTVPKGEFVSLVGPSGCGKSTALKVVAGLEQYDQGTVLVDGSLAKAGRSDCGIMLQSAVLLPWRTVRQNVLLPIEIFAMDKAEADARADQLLDTVGLTEFQDKYPWELSGGMQQRASLARLLVFEPQLLLLDEPFAALDVPLRARLRSLLRTLQHEIDATTIIVTHDPLDAILLADEIIVMHDGRILQQDATKLLIRRPGSLTIAALVGVDNVFAARVDAQGRPWLSGVDEPLAAGPLSFAAGDDYLLRVAPDAVALHPQGRHAGWIDDRIELGDAAQWSIRWGAATLRVAAPASTSASAAPATREACRFDIDSQGIDVWRPAPALA